MSIKDSLLKLVASILFFLMFPIATALSATIYVPDDYTTIQGAVDSANPGDTIIVRDGTYAENVNVDKNNLSIQSENGAETTVIQTTEPVGDIFYVTSDYVTITG